MRIAGSNLRIRKPLGRALAAIQCELRVPFHERFCGTLATSWGLRDAGGEPGRATDKDPCLMALWGAVRAGRWEPPARVSVDEYAELFRRREELRTARDPLYAFVGLFCSFKGKYWAGRIADDFRWKGETAIYAAAKARRDVLHLKPMIERMEIACARFQDDRARPGVLTFDDPPYGDTLDHWRPASGEDEPFDAKLYWETVDEEKWLGPHLVMEFAAPNGWEPVARWELKSPGMRKCSTETLWAPTCGALTAKDVRLILAAAPPEPKRRRKRSK